uniref:Uncharacterized protein n=1 Tax=viral metagenome TaxID=1070528 RepID=A0A6C0HLZ8_9ZZZZ
MFAAISDFFNSVMSFSLNISVTVKIIILIITIIVLLVGMYSIREQFEYSYFRHAYFWYFFVAFVNLISILIIVYFYNAKNGNYVGPPGATGTRGKRGKSGKFLTCSYCKTNLYIQKQQLSTIICKIILNYEPFNVEYNKMPFEALKYFDALIAAGSIDYSQFVTNIILAKTGDPAASDAVAKFKTLMVPNSLAFQLIDEINHSIGKSDNLIFGSFKRPNASMGYTILGDVVAGGTEQFNLNCFIISGDILFPQGYNLLVSFQSYNQDTGKHDTFTIWRPIGQNVMEQQQTSATGTTPVPTQYTALGDICSLGTTTPPLNLSAIIRETCLEEVSSEYATMIFIYCGIDLTFTDETHNVDYTQTTSYLIENKIANNIQIFSVWRTPLNTFITNSNSDNQIINNTVAFNIYNNLSFALNENGNLKTEARQYLITYLSTVQIKKITSAALLCKHFDMLYARELIYYINKAQSTLYGRSSVNTSTPEPTLNLSTLSLNLSPDAPLGDMMAAIAATIIEFNTYNANIGITDNSTQPPGYFEKSGYLNPNTQKKLPDDLMSVYNIINAELASLPVQIENTNTMLDIINCIFDAGFDTRIAIDSEGITEGGIMMTEIQELVIRICKVLMPPIVPIYMIKDECLGDTPIDNTHLELTHQFTEVVSQHNKYITFQAEDTNAQGNMQHIIRQQEQVLNNELGQVVGHIKGWYENITKMDLSEFTDSRIKSMIFIYKKTNEFYENAFSGVNIKVY